MNTERLEELLEQIVSQNDEIIKKLSELVTDASEIKEELNWIGQSTFAQQVVEGLHNIDSTISMLDNT